MSKLKTILFTATSAIFGIVGYSAIKGYQLSTAPSNLELALEKLNFNGYNKGDTIVTKQKEQEALLKILYFAGYFSPEQLWKDLNRIGGIENPEKAFKSIYTIIVKSGANQDDQTKFNVKYLRKNLFNSDLDMNDSKDLILYVAQHAFRKIGQERNELTAKKWMEQYKEEYLKEAKILGLIDRKDPTLDKYDGGWIAGASRIGALARLIDYAYNLSKGVKVDGDTVILAGQRELWANIDGVSPTILELLIDAMNNKTNIDNLDTLDILGKDYTRINEGKEYMLTLAKRFNIELDPYQPFIQYNTKEECPLGRFPGRVYANYSKEEKNKLTETIMSQDLLNTYFGHQEVTIVDTLEEGNIRPNTSTTARDAAENLVKKINNGDYGNKKSFVILFESNQPYIERQTLATQASIDNILKQSGLDKKGYSIKIDGVGFGNKQDVPIIHSELAALLAEKYKITGMKDGDLGIKQKRPIDDLLFQTRNNELEAPKEPIDLVGQPSSGLIQYFKELWDDYLE